MEVFYMEGNSCVCVCVCVRESGGSFQTGILEVYFYRGKSKQCLFETFIETLCTVTAAGRVCVHQSHAYRSLHPAKMIQNKCQVIETPHSLGALTSRCVWVSIEVSMDVLRPR